MSSHCHINLLSSWKRTKFDGSVFYVNQLSVTHDLTYIGIFDGTDLPNYGETQMSKDTLDHSIAVTSVFEQNFPSELYAALRAIPNSDIACHNITFITASVKALESHFSTLTKVDTGLALHSIGAFNIGLIPRCRDQEEADCSDIEASIANSSPWQIGVDISRSQRRTESVVQDTAETDLTGDVGAIPS